MGNVTIVKNGWTEWLMVVKSPQEKGFDFAREELQRYVQQMSGGAIRPVEKEDEDKPYFVLSLRKDLSPQDLRLIAEIPSGYDGYAIGIIAGDDSHQPRIIIASDNGCGMIYGVYDILEQLGCRWFYPAEDPHDPEVVPRADTLTLDSCTRAIASPMQYRICNGSEWFFEINPAKALLQMDWAIKNRYNAMGLQTESKTSLKSQYERLRDTGLLYELERRAMFLHGPAHSFDHFLKAEEYMETHPDWFGLRDGKRVPQTYVGAQFCWSNIEARRQFVKNAMDFIKDALHIHIFCTIPFDGGIACACENCQKQGASNLLMTITAELTDALAKVRPDALLETIGGYGPATDPPTDIELHKKLRVIWAHWGRYHAYGYDDPRYDRKDNLAAWRKACKGGITIAQYYTDNFAEPWVLPPFTVAILGDRKYFLETNMDSVYMLMWPKGYWWNHSLNGFLAGRCFYEVGADPYALVHDYALAYFGSKAGKYIASYYEEWARNPDLAYRVRDDAEDCHRAMLAEQRTKYIEPAIQESQHDSVYAYRVAKVERLHTLAERLAEMYRQRDEIRALRSAGKFEEARTKLEQANSYTDSVLDYFYFLADLNQGLIERKEVSWIIKMKIKDWVTEENNKIAAKDRTTEPNTIFQQPDETQVLPSEITGDETK